VNEENKTELNKEQQDPAKEKLRQATNVGLNAATGGKWNKVRNAPILGAAAKKVENAVADKAANSELGKKLTNNPIAKRLANRNNPQNNPVNHKKPDNLGAKTEDQKKEEGTNPNATGDVGKRNLRNSLANRAKNLLGLKK